MDRCNERHFDAINMEYAFAHLFGATNVTRDEAGGADFFHRGDTRSFGQLLVTTATELEKRVGRLKFRSDEMDGDEAGRELRTAVSGLKAIGETLREESADQVTDEYQWLIIGELILTVASLLNYIEARESLLLGIFPPPRQ